jgi:hypothetical protein
VLVPGEENVMSNNVKLALVVLAVLLVAGGGLWLLLAALAPGSVHVPGMDHGLASVSAAGVSV